MSRFLCSMSGPGTNPWIRNAPSRMAMVALPGTPNATVGTSAPPSLALLELSDAITPRTSHDQPPIVETVLHPLPLAFVDAGAVGLGRNRDPRDQQVA